MQDKLLFFLGGDRHFSNYFGIDYATGGKVDFLDYLKKKSKTQGNIVILADILDEKEFPYEEDECWQFFTSEGKNRIFFILHSRNEKIEGTIRNKRSISNISGPLFFRSRLKDNTELSEVEIELLLYILFQIFPDIENDLSGVLSIRIFVPNAILRLPDIINQAYEHYLNLKPDILIGTDFPVIKEELDLKEFRIDKLDYNPFDFEIDKAEEVEIEPARIVKMVELSINDQNAHFVYEKISNIRNRILHEKIGRLDSSISIKGAGLILNGLTKREGEINKQNDYHKNNLESIFDILRQLRTNANEEISEVANKFSRQVNDLLIEYQPLKNYLKYFFFNKSNLFLFILTSVSLSLLLYLKLNIGFSNSTFLSILFSLIISIFIWRWRKRKRQIEILGICDDGTQKLLGVLNHYYKKVPEKIWERNISLLNIKIGHTICQYIARSIESLKLVIRNKPLDILGDIFPSKQKMIFFIPSKAMRDTDMSFDDFDCYMSMDKNDLTDYLKKKYFSLSKNVTFETISSAKVDTIKYFREFCDQPDLGLLWDKKDVVDYRESRLNKYLFKPKELSIDQADNISLSRISDFVALEQFRFNVATLLSLFKFKES